MEEMHWGRYSGRDEGVSRPSLGSAPLSPHLKDHNSKAL